MNARHPPAPPQNGQPVPQWLSWALRATTISLFLVITTGLAVTIIALTIRSATQNGIVRIPNKTTPLVIGSITIDWSLGLLWTTLPALVFTLYGHYWDWIVQALGDRQPFVELCQPNGAKSEKTILLEYRTTPALWRWIQAFKIGHTLIGASMLLSLVISFAVSPLSARLFVADVRQIPQQLGIYYNYSINLDGINSSVDWRTVFDTVAATRVYNGSRLPWTDDEYAFLPFFLQQNPGDVGANISLVSLTANTTAYSAYVNCSSLTEYQLTLDKTSSSNGMVTVNAIDRGCAVSQSFEVADMQPVYFKTTSDISCSVESWYSRLIFTYGVFSSSSPSYLADVSVISCITDYRVSSGDLTVIPALQPSDTVTKSFMPNSMSDDNRPDYWRGFEQDILGPFSFNPTTKWSTTDFGSLILYYATKVLGGDGSQLGSDSLLTSISDMFTAVYLTAVTMVGTSPLQGGSGPLTDTGTMVAPTTRLFVVTWVSVVIVIILFIALVAAGLVLNYVRRQGSMLQEEPKGLFSYAGLLSGSPLITMAEQLTAEDGMNNLMAMYRDQGWWEEAEKLEV
ncbi:hypothetical protein F5883DRAFT_697563 [Diaporthe sp. PMI_573]|nr:hypothetical protein F5883DRAFT_697563 [Diaporthaceae sp. PMI_573]